MTGAGFAAGPTEVGDTRIEVRAVNGKAMSVRLRLPAVCAGLEAACEELLRQRIGRGSLQLVLEVASAPSLPDRDQLRRAALELQGVAAELGLPAPTLGDVLHAMAASSRGEPTTARPLPPRLRALLEQALADLAAHRALDGRSTVAAIVTQLDEFAGQVAAAAARAPQLVDAHRQRLQQRIQEFLVQQGVSPPPTLDLLREVALHADRIDVAEELVRLRAHLGEFRAVLERGGEVGRRLEFLLQELLRETNTLGSKSPDTVMAHTVVAMKSLLDRIKEQVANLE